MAYKPIESYGVIGDLHTVALVGMDGSIDWCCLPHFDSPSIFAAILDEHKGGFFKIASLYEAQHKQMYLPDSNVLVTRFLSPEGVGEVVDFMPVQDPSRAKKTHHIVRFSLVSRFPLARQGTGVATEFLLHPGEYALAVGLLRLQPQPELLAHHGGKEPPHRMRLPAGRLHDRRDAGAARLAQQSQHPRLLRMRAGLMIGGNPSAGRLSPGSRCRPRLAGSRRFALG